MTPCQVLREEMLVGAGAVGLVGYGAYLGFKKAAEKE
jgi:hypothetical protein